MNRIQFLALCCPSIAIIRKEGWGCCTVLQFLWVGLSRVIILSMRRKQLLIINLLKCVYCPGNFSLEVGTYDFHSQRRYDNITWVDYEISINSSKKEYIDVVCTITSPQSASLLHINWHSTVHARDVVVPPLFHSHFFPCLTPPIITPSQRMWMYKTNMSGGDEPCVHVRVVWGCGGYVMVRVVLDPLIRL